MVGHPLAATAALACGHAQPPATTPAAPESITGIDWTLVALEESPTGPGNEGRPATLLFSVEGKRVSGFAGCNRISGTHELEADEVRFGPLALTRMAWATGMELEARFTAALGATRRYRRSGQHLQLLGDRGVVAELEAR